MATQNPVADNGSFREEMLKILLGAADSVKARKCQAYSYTEHLIMGVERVISESTTGRAFIQGAIESGRLGKLTFRTFFYALESETRLEFLKQVSAKLIETHTPTLKDNLSDIPELDNFDVKIGDGHFHEHATHEKKINGKNYSVGHMYFMDAKTHLIRPVGMLKDSLGNKKKADIKLLQEHKNKLRFDAPFGRKVLIVYDRASIDFHLWWQLKKSKGVYFLSREKANMTLKDNIIGEKEFDLSDPRNSGVVSDQICGCHAHVSIRRITYVDPETGNTFVFITNEMTLPPGVVAFLYKLRWDIEKKFDFFKNALNEKKSWSKSLAGKKQQALFLCIAHNLLTILQDLLARKHGISDRKCLEKRRRKIEEYKENMKRKNQMINPLIATLRKLSKFSLQFFRTIRMKYFSFSSWDAFIRDIRLSTRQYFY
jgi:hypothetical protein